MEYVYCEGVVALMRTTVVMFALFPFSLSTQTALHGSVGCDVDQWAVVGRSWPVVSGPWSVCRGPWVLW